MQFIDLKIQQEQIKNNIQERINNVLTHGKYILGPEVKELETKLATYADSKYGIGVANGSDALVLALQALEVGRGDAVFVSSFTFFASASAVTQVGATPIFIDVDERTFNISIQDLENQIKLVSDKKELTPKAIIAVDLFGQIADFSKLEEISRKYNLKLIEDAAQSMGATQNGSRACSFGDIATTSFFPAKPLGCYGDGGMIFTNDESIKDVLNSLRVHGKGTDKYDNVRIGKNSRLDTIQAAILLAKFDIFEREIELRQEVAEYYSSKLKDYFDVPFIVNNNESAWAQYSLLTDKREKCIKTLKENDIPSAIYYPKALHEQKAFSYLEKRILPITENICKKVFSIPFYPYLTRKDQDIVIAKLIESVK